MQKKFKLWNCLINMLVLSHLTMYLELIIIIKKKKTNPHVILQNWFYYTEMMIGEPVNDVCWEFRKNLPNLSLQRV